MLHIMQAISFLSSSNQKSRELEQQQQKMMIWDQHTPQKFDDSHKLIVHKYYSNFYYLSLSIYKSDFEKKIPTFECPTQTIANPANSDSLFCPNFKIFLLKCFLNNSLGLFSLQESSRLGGVYYFFSALIFGHLFFNQLLCCGTAARQYDQ